MELAGHVYRISDPQAAFLSAISGGGSPTEGFIDWPDVQVKVMFYIDLRFFGGTFSASGQATTGPDGSFLLPAFIGDVPFTVTGLSIQVFAGTWLLYRSEVLSPEMAASRPLDIWLFPDLVGKSQGVTAGSISAVLDAAHVPGDTTVQSTPSGLVFSLTDDQVSAQFGLSITPDTSLDRAIFLDAGLQSWAVQIGWPTDMAVTVGQVVAILQSGVQAAGSAMNAGVLTQMAGVLAAEAGVPAPVATAFLNDLVTVSFMNVSYPVSLTWSVHDQSNPTVVLIADPCIGFPRKLL